MKVNALIIVLLIFTNCKQNNKLAEVANLATTETTSDTINKNELKIYDFVGFKKFLSKKDDKIYVINFWATWCSPCVKELPYFEQLNKNYKDKKVEVILVSLDFPHLYDKKLKPFIKENALQSNVIVLNDPNMNSWIPKVDESWSGSIPATIIYKNDVKKFFEKSFNYIELESEIKQFLK